MTTSDPSSDPTHNSAPPITRVEVAVDTRAPIGTTNVYLADGLLVDPAARTDELDEAVVHHRSEDPADPGIEAIAVTHTHPDHVGAVAAYAELTATPVFAHADHTDRFADATGVDPDGTFRDGESVGDTGVHAVDTPGHASDHVAFAVGGHGADDEMPRELLCGDLAVAEGSVVVGAPDGDLRDYLASLERVRDAGYDRLYPGHGSCIDDPETGCQRLIDHRLEREHAILRAVESGADTVDAVVDAAYEKDVTGVKDLARVTVVAHLEKLVAEDRVDGSWSGPTP